MRFRIRETPGHTPEGISIVVYDLAKSDQRPEAVFTGDTLFVGDVGRPDLMASVGVSADQLAGWLYESLHQKLMTLPDETLVYPAHGAGSMCGKNLGSETFSTIGEQREFNYALQPMSEEEFKAVVTAEQPEAPAYFGYDAALNKRERATLEENLERVMKPLSVDEVVRMQQEGARVLDVRDAADFAGSHLKGSINIGLNGKFATWVGSLLHGEQRPIVVVAEPGTEHEAIMRLGRIGTDDVVGYLDGGLGALDGHADLLATTERVTAQALKRLLDEDGAPQVVDVRSETEWEGGHIEGSLNLPLNHLLERLVEVPEGRRVVVVCRSGYRSSIASSLLLENGHAQTLDLVGGMDAWTASALPMKVLQATACQTGNAQNAKAERADGASAEEAGA